MLKSRRRRRPHCLNCGEACLGDCWRPCAQNDPVTGNRIFKWRPPTEQTYYTGLLYSIIGVLWIWHPSWKLISVEIAGIRLSEGEPDVLPVGSILLSLRAAFRDSPVWDSGHVSVNSTVAKRCWVSCFIQFLSMLPFNHPTLQYRVNSSPFGQSFLLLSCRSIYIGSDLCISPRLSHLSCISSKA